MYRVAISVLLAEFFTPSPASLLLLASVVFDRFNVRFIANVQKVSPQRWQPELLRLFFFILCLPGMGASLKSLRAVSHKVGGHIDGGMAVTGNVPYRANGGSQWF